MSTGKPYPVQLKTFYVMSYPRLAEITKEVYGLPYDTHRGMGGVSGPHTHLVSDEESSDYAKGEMHAFVIGGGAYYPHTKVILDDLARQGYIPPGSYLI